MVYSFFLIFILMMMTTLIVNNYKKTFLVSLKNDIKKELRDYKLENKEEIHIDNEENTE